MVFENVFKDSLASVFEKTTDSKPREFWAEIDSALTTVTLNKSVDAVRELTFLPGGLVKVRVNFSCE